MLEDLAHRFAQRLGVPLLKPQVWVWLASLATFALAVICLFAGEPRWVAGAVLAAAVCWILARRVNRRSPAPFPFALRALLRLPRPYQSLKQLQRLLEARRGDRLLEIGPGVGTHAIPIAESIAPGGVLDVVDVQHEMLEEIVRRARIAGVTNIAVRQGDASRLPYRDRTFDGAYMIGTLGEISDGDGALREFARVLKANAPLVIGEVAIDPDFVPFRNLRRRATRAGFQFIRKTGSPVAYLARFEPPRNVAGGP